MGSGFGTPGNGTSVKVIYFINTSQKQQTFNGTSGAIRLWNATRIILAFNPSWFVISVPFRQPTLACHGTHGTQRARQLGSWH
jgi:hypothetical protein